MAFLNQMKRSVKYALATGFLGLLLLLMIGVTSGTSVNAAAAPPPPVAAPAAAAGQAANYQPMTFTRILVILGPTGWIQIGISIWGLAITIQFFIEIRRDKLAPNYLQDELQGLVEEGQFEEALNLCEDDDCYLTRVVGAGLGRMESGSESMKHAMEEVAESEGTVYLQKVSWLAFIAGVEPLLGLLGTVIGMIQAFDKIAKLGNPNANDLAEGISKALFTTALGLIVAVPISVFFSLFKNRVIKIILDVNLIGSDVVDQIKVGGGGGGGAA